jgi:hypothetical protein
LITSNSFSVVLTPSIHGDFIACVLIKVVWGMDKVPIYLYYWHVFKAWRLCVIKKIKDVEVHDPSIMDKQFMTSKSVGGLL